MHTTLFITFAAKPQGHFHALLTDYLYGTLSTSISTILQKTSRIKISQREDTNIPPSKALSFSLALVFGNVEAY